jgi:iron complex outermembrane receptor protein
VGPAAAFLLLLSLSAQPDADRRDRAREHFEAGREHHKLGRFDDAIAEYEVAYELVPLPDILFNIGQCYRNLSNHERAIFFFERFLHESPDATDAPAVRKLIRELEHELALTKVEKAETATVALAPPPPPPPPEALAPPPVEAEVEAEGVHRQWWFWTIIVVGVAAAAAAGSAYALRPGDPPAGTLGTIDLRDP